jgi:hypothetical protein
LGLLGPSKGLSLGGVGVRTESSPYATYGALPSAPPPPGCTLHVHTRNRPPVFLFVRHAGLLSNAVSLNKVNGQWHEVTGGPWAGCHRRCI